MPESWEWTTIGEIASSILYGVSESAKEKGRYKLLRITDIQNNKVNWETVPFTDYDNNKAQAYLLNDGDILFARTGATVGKSYLVEGLKDSAIYASYLIRVQTSSVILPSYIKFFLESGFYWEQISLNSVGIGQPNVNGTTLAALTIPIPPYREQLRIVEETKKWLAVIDGLDVEIDILQTYITQAKSKILDLAIHGKLVPQDPNDEPAIEFLKRKNSKFTPLKALIIHNSQYPSVLTRTDRDVNLAYGFGIPSHIDKMLYNNEDEFTMVWQPEISPTSGVDYQIIGFPYPSSLVDKDGNFYGVVTVTIVSNPILRGSEGNEYCQNDIEVSIEPIDSIEYITVGAPGVSPVYRNETRVHSTKNILTPSAYSKKHHSMFLKERNLIITQNKYQPVKKFQVDLSTLKPAIKAKMKGKTEWVLRIKGFTRDTTKDELIAHMNETGEVISVPVTIIVSIKDPLGQKVVYDEGIRLLNQNNFPHTNILIRKDIEIDAGNINEQ